ncbi:hypothetical protein C8Q78DRAFT_1022067 [Trametes maxima]|nr:hypothetical protein C8Q78DRAFT_1022067 [Trametes maxima]
MSLSNLTQARLNSTNTGTVLGPSSSDRGGSFKLAPTTGMIEKRHSLYPIRCMHRHVCAHRVLSSPPPMNLRHTAVVPCTSQATHPLRRAVKIEASRVRCPGSTWRGYLGPVPAPPGSPTPSFAPQPNRHALGRGRTTRPFRGLPPQNEPWRIKLGPRPVAFGPLSLPAHSEGHSQAARGCQKRPSKHGQDVASSVRPSLSDAFLVPQASGSGTKGRGRSADCTHRPPSEHPPTTLRGSNPPPFPFALVTLSRVLRTLVPGRRRRRRKGGWDLWP